MGICLYYVIYDHLWVFKDYVSIQLLSLLFVIALYSSILNLLIQLLLLFYFVLYPVWITYPPQDPIIRSSATPRSEDRFVPVLGSTPSAATLSDSYPRAHLRSEQSLNLSKTSRVLLNPKVHYHIRIMSPYCLS